MKNFDASKNKKALKELCSSVKKHVYNGDYEKSKELVIEALGNYPHSPEPHNLIGILLEIEGDHLMALKHFRAAWNLDPTYLPASQNLKNFDSVFPQKKFAFDEADCSEENTDKYSKKTDEHGIGYVVRSKKK